MKAAEPTLIRVTVEDTVTGQSDVNEIIDNYVITTAGTCYVAHQQDYTNGTTILTIKGRK